MLPDNRACWYFSRHAQFLFVPERRVPTRPFVWKKGRCHWCGREFSYKAYEQNYVRLFCRKRHKRKYKRFWREQDSLSNVYSLLLSWGEQPATEPISIMEIITPTQIAYFNQAKFLARYYCLFVVDEFGICIRSAFVTSDD